MGMSSAWGLSVHTQMIIAVSCQVVVMGCDGSDGMIKNRTKLRAQSCQQAGVTGDELKTCISTDQGYRRIMEPIWARQEREEIAAFNAALHALPSLTIPKERYEMTSLIELSKELDRLEMTDVSKWSKHPLFGKRFRMDAEVQFHPTDFESKLLEHTTLSKSDATSTWQVEADTESLSREERTFVKDQCEPLFEACHGEIYGLIGIITRDHMPALGIQIEHMEITPREPKKSS